MRVILTNERDNPDMTDAQLRSDLKKIAKEAETWGADTVVGGNEFFDVADDKALRDAFPPPKYVIYGNLDGRSTGNPIVLPTKYYEVLSVEIVTLCTGIESVTPKRTATVVRALRKSRFRKNRKKRAFVCWHWPNGAFNDKFPKTKAIRRLKWNDCKTKGTEIIDELYDEGYDVTWFGDTNSGTPEMHNRQVHVHSVGVLHICAVPQRANRVVKLATGVVRGLFTDHPAVKARFNFLGRILK